jgi:hypothetical protein
MALRFQEGEGEGEGEGGEDQYEGADWYKRYNFDDAQVAVLKEYKSEEEVHKAYVEQKKKLSSGFRMPDTLSDQQKNELADRVAKEQGVPVGLETEKALKAYDLLEAPDEIIVPGMRISEEGKERFRNFCLEKKVPPSVANDLYQFYKQERRYEHGTQQADLEARQQHTFDRLAELHGGEKAVGEGMEYIQQYLTQFSDGPDDWEAFKAWAFQNGKGDSHILMRALWAPAHEAMAEATSPKTEAAAKVKSLFDEDLAKAKEKWPNQSYLWPKPTDSKYRMTS